MLFLCFSVILIIPKDLGMLLLVQKLLKFARIDSFPEYVYKLLSPPSLETSVERPGWLYGHLLVSTGHRSPYPAIPYVCV